MNQIHFLNSVIKAIEALQCSGIIGKDQNPFVSFTLFHKPTDYSITVSRFLHQSTYENREISATKEATRIIDILKHVIPNSQHNINSKTGDGQVFYIHGQLPIDKIIVVITGVEVDLVRQLLGIAFSILEQNKVIAT